MKRLAFLGIIGIIALAVTGCHLNRTSVPEVNPVKVVNPQSPYLDDNITVLHERTETQSDRAAKSTGRIANMPVRFWDKMTMGFKGQSDMNPYDRSQPYFRSDFKKDELAKDKQDITQPDYMRGERYAKAYRSPFIFKEELTRGGTNEMKPLTEVEASLMAKQYLDLQKSLEEKLLKAETLYTEKKYSEALELVDQVLDADTSSREARSLFEKIIKAREESKYQKESEMRDQIAKNEKINQYLGQAKDQLAQDNFEEALRLAKMAVSVDNQHAAARDMVDTIELAQFEANLRAQGMSSVEVLETMIYEHLKLYQQYEKENLQDLAKQELQKVSILEAYRDKITGAAPASSLAPATK